MASACSKRCVELLVFCSFWGRSRPTNCPHLSPHRPGKPTMVKKNRRPRTKQTKSQLKRKKADQHTGFVRVNHKFGNEVSFSFPCPGSSRPCMFRTPGSPPCSNAMVFFAHPMCWDALPFIPLQTIAKNWDRRLTLNQNFERMGLVADANSDFAQANSSRAMVKRLTKSAIVGASIENAELEKQKKAAAEQIISGPFCRPLGRAAGAETDDNPVAGHVHLHRPMIVLPLPSGFPCSSNRLPSSSLVLMAVKHTELQASADAPRVPIPKGLSVDDQQILRKLMAKHGEDYEVCCVPLLCWVGGV